MAPMTLDSESIEAKVARMLLKELSETIEGNFLCIIFLTIAISMRFFQRALFLLIELFRCMIFVCCFQRNQNTSHWDTHSNARATWAHRGNTLHWYAHANGRALLATLQKCCQIIFTHKHRGKTCQIDVPTPMWEFY